MFDFERPSRTAATVGPKARILKAMAMRHLWQGGALGFATWKRLADDERVLSSFQGRRFHFSLARTVEDN